MIFFNKKLKEQEIHFNIFFLLIPFPLSPYCVDDDKHMLHIRIKFENYFCEN